jgi:hypothetical protein
MRFRDVFYVQQARKEFLQQAARAWHSEQEAEKHGLLLDFCFNTIVESIMQIDW